jgi:hypothetical protein
MCLEFCKASEIFKFPHFYSARIEGNFHHPKAFTILSSEYLNSLELVLNPPINHPTAISITNIASSNLPSQIPLDEGSVPLDGNPVERGYFFFRPVLLLLSFPGFHRRVLCFVASPRLLSGVKIAVIYLHVQSKTLDGISLAWSRTGQEKIKSCHILGL